MIYRELPSTSPVSVATLASLAPPRLSSKLGTRVLASYANLDKELKEIEKKYYLEHGTLPNKTTNELYSSTLKKRNVAKAIPRNLDITL